MKFTSEDYSLAIHKFKPIIIRRELFKLFYLEDLFNVNEKADAAEAFCHILSIIHASCTKTQGMKGTELDVDIKCPNDSCLVHQIFSIKTLTKKKCKCG